MNFAKSNKEYFEECHPYDLLIKHNYMRHREIIECLKGSTLSLKADPIRILELGCGNAYVAPKAFGHFSNVHFTGVDLSSQALRDAYSILQSTSWEIQLIEGDIKKTVAGLNGDYDLIVAGFAMHHFLPDSIQRILDQLKPRVTNGGIFFIYDVVTLEEEDRATYHARFIDGIDLEATKLSVNQLSMIKNHVENFDFPISFSEWKECTLRAGFQSCEMLYRDKDARYTLMQIA